MREFSLMPGIKVENRCERMGSISAHNIVALVETKRLSGNAPRDAITIENSFSIPHIEE